MIKVSYENSNGENTFKVGSIVHKRDENSLYTLSVKGYKYVIEMVVNYCLMCLLAQFNCNFGISSYIN